MNHYSQIEKHGVCISEDQLLLYLKGKIPIGDQKAIEWHLLHCDLCADAAEGFRLVKNKDKTNELLASLRKKINTDLNPSAKYKNFTSSVWQIAAILLILLLSAGGYFVIQHAAEKTKIELANLHSGKKFESNEITGQSAISENIKQMPSAKSNHYEKNVNTKAYKEESKSIQHVSKSTSLSG